MLATGGAARDASSRPLTCDGGSATVVQPESVSATGATLVAYLAEQGCALSFQFIVDGPSGELVTPVHSLNGPSEQYEWYRLPIAGLEPGATYVVRGDVRYPGPVRLGYPNGQPPEFRTMARLDVTLRGAGRVVSAPAGIDCGAVCGVDLPIGGGLQLTATPAAGYRFGHWEGDACAGTSPTCAAWATSWTRTTAVFDEASLVTVGRTGTGAGAVTSAPAGLSCGSGCSATFDAGQTVKLTAAPEAGSRFGGWSGACSGTSPTCTFTTAVGTQAVTASFVKVATLTVVRTGRGTVTDGTGRIACGAICAATFDDGSTATLRARPARGYAFGGWSAGCSGKTPSCSVTLTGDETVRASFRKKPKKRRPR